MVQHLCHTTQSNLWLNDWPIILQLHKETSGLRKNIVLSRGIGGNAVPSRYCSGLFFWTCEISFILIAKFGVESSRYLHTQQNPKVVEITMALQGEKHFSNDVHNFFAASLAPPWSMTSTFSRRRRCRCGTFCENLVMPRFCTCYTLAATFSNYQPCCQSWQSTHWQRSCD